MAKVIGRSQEASILDKARSLQEASGGFAGAEYLHREITGERWGITAQVLDDFLERVKAKLAANSLENTAHHGHPYPQEKFDDPAIGPNMYQINKQVIMPVTKDKGLQFPGVSWSLMSNPSGVMITIFVTHAWAEGVLEFGSNVLSKWPDGLAPGGVEHAAYICFLSNPQHLDISDLLKEIDTSPFKRALDSMPRPGLMIVSPTQAGPIHSRLWCVAELFWATEQEIPIIVGGVNENLADPSQAAAAAEAREVAVELGRKIKCMRWTMRSVHCIWLGAVVALVVLGVMKSLEDNANEGCEAESDEDCSNPFVLPFTIASYAMGVVTCLCCANCAFQVKSMRAYGREEVRAESGAFVDIKDAHCGHEDDEARIRKALEGKETELNKLLGRLIVHGVCYDEDIENRMYSDEDVPQKLAKTELEEATV